MPLFFMKFTGRYNNNRVFIPIQAHRKSYNAFTDRLFKFDMLVHIEIKDAKTTSEAQIGLFNVVVNLVIEQTNARHDDIMKVLSPILLKEFDNNQNLIRTRFNDYTTAQFSVFIEQAIIMLNEEYNLNIDLVKEDNKTKVING